MSDAASAVDSFIARWQDVTASELATAQSFVIELCRLLDILEALAALAALGRARRVEDGRWMG